MINFSYFFFNFYLKPLNECSQDSEFSKSIIFIQLILNDIDILMTIIFI